MLQVLAVWHTLVSMVLVGLILMQNEKVDLVAPHNPIDNLVCWLTRTAYHHACNGIPVLT